MHRSVNKDALRGEIGFLVDQPKGEGSGNLKVGNTWWI